MALDHVWQQQMGALLLIDAAQKVAKDFQLNEVLIQAKRIKPNNWIMQRECGYFKA